MALVARLRPGVYSDYEASGVIWASSEGKIVGIVAQSSVGVNQVFSISRASDARANFGDSILTDLCILSLQNGASKVLAVPVDKASPDYTAAFRLLGEQQSAYVWICDSEDLSVHQMLNQAVLKASSELHECIGIVSCSKDADYLTWSDSFNSERFMLIAQSPLDNDGKVLPSYWISAALAGVVAKSMDPTTSLNGFPLKGIHRLSESLTESKVDEMIEHGITPLEVIVENAEIIRAVSSRTLTNGMGDLTFRDINTILIIDEVIPGVRSALKKNLLGESNNALTRSSIATQTAIVLQDFHLKGFIESYQSPVVSPSEADPSVCVVEIGFAIAHGLNQILVSADIKV